ncbi:glycosyltransferase family 39 protein [Candidatus Woesebacteria bacterium]|nr:glycosyltransferase family 39 protein [Candidatus Woesebacteria bacterium]
MDKDVGKRKMILVILLLALALRMVSINQSLWLDEGTSAILARDFSLERILTEFSPGDFHPPLYYLFLKVWAGIFGSSEVGLRSFSLLAGLATVYVVYLIGKRLLDRKAGLLAALFLATSGLHLYYSQEARMYALSALFVSGLFYFFLKILDSKKRIDWYFFSLLLFLNGLTDYLPNLVIVSFWVFALVAKKDKGWWRNFLLSHIPLVAAYLWWLPTFTNQLRSGLGVFESAPGWWKVLGRTNLKELLLVPVKFALGRISFVDKGLYALVSGTVLLTYSFLVMKAKNIKEGRLRLIWLWLIVPIALAAILGLKLSVFSYFRLIFAIPAFFLLIVFGILQLRGRLFKASVLFVLCVNLLASGAYLFNARFHREDWRGLVSLVEKASRDKNAITIFVTDGQTEAYRYYSKGGKIAGPEGLSASYEQLWLMRYVQEIFDPEDKLRKETERLGFVKKGEYDFNGVVVWEYERE